MLQIQSGIKYSFPYQPQSSLEWKFYGPFEKDADAKEIFLTRIHAKYFFKTVTGGTVVLRHWWAPLIKGAIDSIKPNQVWYATTQIWSDENTTKPFWIGFNNLSDLLQPIPRLHLHGMSIMQQLG
jgi:hexosaminidase